MNLATPVQGQPVLRQFCLSCSCVHIAYSALLQGHPVLRLRAGAVHTANLLPGIS